MNIVHRTSILLALVACTPDKDPLDTAGPVTITGLTGNNSGNASNNDPSTLPMTGATTDDPDPTGGPDSTGGPDPTGGPSEPTREVCERYLSCLAVTSPRALPQAQQGFGPDGTCWDGPPESQEQCITACQVALAELYQYYYPDEPACALCQTDEHCGPNMMCEDGGCVDIVLPGCGDGIVQPDETCETPACDVNCQEAPCNPFSHAGCPEGQECRFAFYDAQYSAECLPPLDSLPKDGHACEYDPNVAIEYCAPGLVCAPAELIAGCPQEGCCTRLCNTQEPDDCPNGRTCEPFYLFPYYSQYVGLCVLL